MEPSSVFPDDPPRLVRRRLLPLGVQANRRGEGEPAHPDVGQPARAVDLHLQEHVRARRRFGARAIDPDARAARLDAEPHRLEHLEKKTVLLEAVAAPSPPDQLVEDGLRAELDRAPEQHVQVLERDRLRVGRRERVQRRQRRRARSGVADAGEVGVEVEHLRKRGTYQQATDAASDSAPQGGPDPGVGGSGVWFQALELSQAVWTNRWTAWPFQLPAETETQPP